MGQNPGDFRVEGRYELGDMFTETETGLSRKEAAGLGRWPRAGFKKWKRRSHMAITLLIKRKLGGYGLITP